MADIIIRKAKKDYVCNVCGHIIRSGEEYLDKVITHDAKAVRHERYHDECPCKDDGLLALFRKFVDSDFDLPVEQKSEHTKFHLSYIGSDIGLLSWDYKANHYVTHKTFFDTFEWRF